MGSFLTKNCLFCLAYAMISQICSKTGLFLSSFLLNLRSGFLINDPVLRQKRVVYGLL